MNQNEIPPELFEQLRKDRGKIADELPELKNVTSNLSRRKMKTRSADIFAERSTKAAA